MYGSGPGNGMAFDTPAVRESTLGIHRAILAAIVAKDPEAARRRMARHDGAAREVAMGRGQARQDPSAAKRERRSDGDRPATGSGANKKQAKTKRLAGGHPRASKETG